MSAEHLFYVLFCIVDVALIGWLIRDSRRNAKKARQWSMLAEGEFDRAEYGHYPWTTRSGAMVHTTSTHTMTVTAVFLVDGRSFVLRGRHDAPFPRGTRVCIVENGLGRRRLQSVAS